MHQLAAHQVNSLDGPFENQRPSAFNGPGEGVVLQFASLGSPLFGRILPVMGATETHA